MRILVLLVLCNLSFLKSFGQQPVQEWLNEYWQPIPESEKGERFRMVTKDADGKLNGPVTEYYSAGKKRMTGNFSNGEETGEFEYFHPNGQLESRGKYTGGNRVGNWQSWYANGQLRQQGYYIDDFNKTGHEIYWQNYRIESFWDSTGTQHVKNGTGNSFSFQENGKLGVKGQYKNGLQDGEWLYYREDGSVENNEIFSPAGLVTGNYYAPDGKIHAYDANSLEQLPEFPGGYKKLSNFLSQNLKYPKEARNKKIAGIVYINFVIDYTGMVKDVAVLKGIGGGCDEEAARVVSIMPQWTPGRQRGKPVSVRYALPIRFTSL